MKTVCLLFLFVSILAAQENFVGKHAVTDESGTRYLLIPEPNESFQVPFIVNSSPPAFAGFDSQVRWNYTAPSAIGSRCAVSGNGDYSAVGWYLNNPRISLYDNNSSTPLWEYTLPNSSVTNHLSFDEAGSKLAVGSDLHVYIFPTSSSTPTFDFDLSSLGGAIAGPVELTSSGDFLIATANYFDSSIVFGFDVSSTSPVWSQTIIPSTGSGSIQGLNMSGNDSLMIVNTYGEFYIINTFTGSIVYQDLINPVSSSGTQTRQGISYDGSIIATVNLRGYVRVFQWNGSTYNLIWEDQEPPGAFYNWAVSVDVSDDAEYISVGTLIFVSSSEYNGTVKLYKTSDNGSVSWEYDNCGDNVDAVRFNKDGNVLAAVSWGDLNNTTADLFVFKTWEGNTPIFTVNSPGSFFSTGISDDGSTVFASGKAVHARVFGSGGLAYNVFIDTSDTNIPVELTSFSATSDEGKIILSWTTATELNNLGFEIERSVSDQTNFVTIGSVEGNGTTTEQKNYSFTDSKLSPGIYFYRLKQIDYQGTYEYSDIVSSEILTPLKFSLQQNYPNPFNPITRISWQSPVNGNQTLKIYDMLGNEVAVLINEYRTAGNYEIEFSAEDLSSGIYLYKLQVGDFVNSKKMMIIK